MGGDEDLLGAVGLPYGDELVALLQAQGTDAAVADVLQGGDGQTLDGAVAGDHDQVQIGVVQLPGVDHGLHLLALAPPGEC